MDDLFVTTDRDWAPVSEHLAAGRIIVGGLTIFAVTSLVAAILAVLAAAVTGWPWWPVAVVVLFGVVAVLWLSWWAERNRRSWGYLEETDDLLVRHGVLLRRVVSVPYGRMQFVDVTAGPVARHFGFATVTLHTASTQTAATIPGVTAAEATRLRNRLTELGSGHDSGL